MTPTTLVGALLALTLAPACGLDAAATLDHELDSAEAQPDAASPSPAPAAVTPVSWRHSHLIGRRTAAQVAVEGGVAVELQGPEFPVVDRRGGEPLTAQNALVTFDLPAFEDPTRIVRRQFYTRFTVVTTEAGRLYAMGPYSQAAAVETTAPDALARFEASFDPVTGRATELTVFEDDRRTSGNFRFVSTVPGELVVDQRFTHLFISRVRNYRQHTFVIDFET